MTSPKALLVLLLVFSLSTAFNPSDYFYSNESSVQVTYENFSSGGNAYSIVSFNAKPVFLLENGEPLMENQKIENLLQSYYLDTYYPSDEEVEELQDLLYDFNASRNDGQKFPGKEEYVCREVIFINGRVKNGPDPIFCRNESDNERCEDAAMLMYQFLSAVSGTPPVSSPTALLDPIKEFGFASYGIDAILDDISSKFEAAEDDRSEMYGALQTTKNSIKKLENNSKKIESSLFGWTSTGSCDVNHWCLCPDMDLDQDALDDIEEKAENLLDTMGPFDQYDEVSSSIYQATTKRMNYSSTEKNAEEFMARFLQLNQSGSNVLALAEEADKHVSNISLSQDISKLKTLHLGIPEEIANRDISDTDANLEEYAAMILKVEDSALFNMNAYNATRDAKIKTDSLLVLLEGKDLDSVSKETLEILQNQTADINAKFRDGLTVEELASLESEYLAVKGEAEKLLNVHTDTPVTNVLLLFRGFASNVNSGIASFAEKTSIMEREDVPQGPFTLGLFSLLVFLSLASIATLVFLYIMATRQFSVPLTRHILTSAFFSVIVLLLGFSAFMFILLGKTSTDATITEFLSDFEAKNSTAIELDLRGVSFSDAGVMTSCAENLANAIESQNKSWAIYRLTDSTCIKVTDAQNTSSTQDACQGLVDEAPSSFVLSYSESKEPPKFSVIYSNKAEISANYDYYDSCPLVALFS